MSLETVKQYLRICNLFILMKQLFKILMLEQTGYRELLK